MLHVLSGEWPFPGDTFQVNPRNPNDPNDLVGVTEFDRREEYVNEIGEGHGLMQLIRSCLSNSPSHRPDSRDVQCQVSAVAGNHPPSFANRVEMLERIKSLGEEKESVVSEMNNAVIEKDTAVREKELVLAELEEAEADTENVRQCYAIELEKLQIENFHLNEDIEHLHAVVNSKERELYSLEENFKAELNILQERCDRQLEVMQNDKLSKQAVEKRHQAQLKSKSHELTSKDALLSSKSSIIQSLQVKLEQALGTSSVKQNLNVFTPGAKLTCTECAKLPEGGGSGHAVVIGNDVYVRLGTIYSMNVLNYNIIEDSWNTLPAPPVEWYSIGYLYKKLLLVGGQLPSNNVTGDIHEFDEASQQWVRSTSIPPMPTARDSSTVVCWSSPPALIVCGGGDENDTPMAVVEVYHGRTSQWYTVSPLPSPRDHMTHTVVNNVLFLVGGYEGTSISSCTKTVMSASIPQLLGSCIQPSSTPPIHWQSASIPDVPYYRSTVASLGGCLLVVGGNRNEIVEKHDRVSSVHAYCPSSSSWVLVGELPQPLYDCITATLPTGELLVIGGGTASFDESNNVYKYSLSL